MSNSSFKRSELWLYGVLLVLPTLVLGWVYWHEFLSEHEALMADVPRKAEDGARRLRETIAAEVRTLLNREAQRPFYHYAESYYPEGTVGAELALVPSPLFVGPPSEGILSWFAYDFRQRLEAEVHILPGGRQFLPGWSEMRDEIIAETHDLVRHEFLDEWLVRLGRIGLMDRSDISLALAAINRRNDDDLECVQSELPTLDRFEQQTLELYVSNKFHLRFYLKDGQVPWIVAARRILIKKVSREVAKEMPDCFSSLNDGVTLVQGFFIDPVWLFHDLPRAASERALGSGLRFEPILVPEDLGSSVYESFNLVDELEMEVFNTADVDFGNLHVVATHADVEARYRSQLVRLVGMTGMLLVSLGTGIYLLLRNVGKELEQAERTENFVSAVTHELRTPISAIRLYGEMLRDGWTTREEKRGEYYERIVQEAGRLETTVERVLEKGRITSTDIVPEPGDLSETVRAVNPELCPDGPAEDLEFHLAEDLPDVWLSFEAVRSILLNLVENARKYAGGSATDPIEVHTRLHRRRVVLEVLDRGPGIPAEERRKVFLAFYRVGNEATRTSQGTGLGLHLVKLQAEGMRARTQIADREGGGTVIRVLFENADGDVS